MEFQEVFQGVLAKVIAALIAQAVIGWLNQGGRVPARQRFLGACFLYIPLQIGGIPLPVRHQMCN